MCAPYSQRGPKARRLTVIGNLSLVVAFLCYHFIRSSGATERDWIDGLCGLLFGISIGTNLLGIWRDRKCVP